MFFDVNQAISACDSDPSLIFLAIKENYKEVTEQVISKPNYNFNITDSDGNNVLMRLLKAKYYDLVLTYLDSSNVDVNHQNDEGDTLMHLLVTINYVSVKEIISKVLGREDFIPNIKNNANETILDRSINNNYIYTTAKILENDKFNNIDVPSFKNLYETYIKSDNYGKYSKISNFELIVDNLKRKPLLPRMRKLVRLITSNRDVIKNDFILARTEKMDSIINEVVKEALV